MKTLRHCWYCLIAAFWIAGRVTGRREFFLLLLIMCFVPLFSLCLNVWIARSFCYLQELEKKTCVKGERTYMRVSITNDKPFPFPLMRITMVLVARSQIARERFSLPPGNSVIFETPLQCPYRGVHSVGITTLEINDSFGLVKNIFNMAELPYYRRMELKVYPQLTDLGALQARDSDCEHIGSAGMWRAEQGESYSGLRPYRPGDPLKRVHRAVSARRREWYVRTYDTPLERSVLIVLDTVAAYESEEEGLYLGDLVCQCAAAIAQYSIKSGYHAVYIDSGLDSALVLEKTGDFEKLYDRLAELEFQTVDGGFERSSKFTARQFFDARTAYIISARGSGDGDIVESISEMKTKLPDIKLIAIGYRVSSNMATDSGWLSAPGVQITKIMVGDDVSEALHGHLSATL
ncbi:MAG: DUF58 domain-containing protein [Oscillospiraceae bacterium]|nr:DUF58 domain-containing protein [Oscillospiraceae bacterium]